MIAGTLSRYFGLRFLGAVLAVFGAVVALVAIVDFVEMLRRAANWQNASPLLLARITLFRIPQLTERIIPFAILVGAMACYLSLSRRMELVVARAGGVSAWQFIAPALVVALAIGTVTTTVYNPVSATMNDWSKRLEAEMLGGVPSNLQLGGTGFWVRQRSLDGQAIINANTSSRQGALLGGVTVFTFDQAGRFQDRIEAKSATLENGYWRLEDARIYAIATPPSDHKFHLLSTNLTRAQVRESFATPESVPFWLLPSYILLAENAGLAAAGYRLQYHKLLALPFFLAAMVLLAAAVSLRFFRFGGIQKMVLSGMAGGFLLYILSKVTDDMSKAELLHPLTAAWTPVLVGGVAGFVALLYQEDG
jgi:lipopolysaccharide export system permease protein